MSKSVEASIYGWDVILEILSQLLLEVISMSQTTKSAKIYMRKGE